MANSDRSRRVTLSDVAKAAGVSVGTASYALRGILLTSPATVKKVQEAARKLGYRPDPVLSQAMSTIRRQPIHGRGEVIAYVVAYDKPDEWRRRHIVRRYWEGAAERAAELGYRIEPYWVGDGSVSEARHSQVLYSRGIRGLILAPHPETEGRLRLDWRHFVSVAVSRSIVEPVTHRVLDDHYGIARMTMEAVLQRGYRRIGFAMSRHRVERVDRLWLAAYLAYQQDLASADRIPPCLQDCVPPEEFDGPNLMAWIKRHRPDALVGPTPRVMQYLQERGLVTPRDFGYAALDLPPEEHGFAGVLHDASEVGRAAISEVVSMLRNRELGLPQKPGLKLVAGTWRDGPSLPRRCR
jgi:LacI family transcriptional regulator